MISKILAYRVQGIAPNRGDRLGHGVIPFKVKVVRQQEICNANWHPLGT
ncbi:MAG: hypothetical protein VKL20_00330 [Synechocystis sp.]|nr:hypothetical protein [Synechocystis sp.]